MIQFVIPLKVTGKYGLNKIYAGVHWSVRKRQAEEIHKLVVLALRAEGIKRKPHEKPVSISILYNTRMDIDNHGYLTKLIIDGLKGYLIQDDSKRYVRGITQGFWEGDGVLVEVRSVKENEFCNR